MHMVVATHHCMELVVTENIAGTYPGRIAFRTAAAEDSRLIKTKPMLRGTTKFTCDDCGHRFVGLDMEWMASVYTMPQKYPKCGSMHTYPRRWFGLNRMDYVQIWEYIDRSSMI